jgi:guanine nucleotide-binding protein subunit alpha
MGACMSSDGNEEGDQKKRSQAIDRTLEEDSKKLRRECKILLLGVSCHAALIPELRVL